VADPTFRPDLYRGAGREYDRFRLPYPQSLTADLAGRVGADGAGRLLDLACGTGQITFAMRADFAQTWAVDQEPDMIDVVRAKAAGLADVHTEVCAAEDLVAPADSFDLVAIGNAFHRLRRTAVAANALRWLRAGGFLALLWGGSPWDGDEPWQQALSATMERWRPVDRIPAGYEEARRDTPDRTILEEAGFEVIGHYKFPAAHTWTPDSVVGFLYSTSILSRRALGDRAVAFEEDLRAELQAAGRLSQVIDFEYDIAQAGSVRTPGT
jgi:SAM-dependent methyltransferase